MGKLTLSTEQETLIADAGAALSPADQKLLRERVLAQLEAAPAIGDGLVETAKPLQRPHLAGRRGRTNPGAWGRLSSR